MYRPTRIALVFALAGCAPETSDSQPMGWDTRSADTPYYTETAGQMRGELPYAYEFERPVEGVLHRDGDVLEFAVEGTDGSWVMLAGTLVLPPVDEGAVDYALGEHGVYGCSGRTDGAIEYDADALGITVTPNTFDVDGAQVPRLTIDAEFELGFYATVTIDDPRHH